MPSPTKPTSQPHPTTEQQVSLRIVCKAPPRPEDHGAEFGLQDSSSTTCWNLHPGAVQPNGDHHFEFQLRVRPQARTGAPNFLGEFAHGQPTQRFVYLSWRPLGLHPGRSAPSNPSWSRRMKVHLRSITWDQIRRVVREGGVLEAVVEGTGRDGGPNCASVKLLGDGWTVRKR